MSSYEITDDMLGRPHISEDDVARFPEEFKNLPYEAYDSTKEKFDTVGALIAHHWTLDSSQDEDCGTVGYGNDWHALFRSERLVLRTSNSGFVTAWRIPDDRDVDEYWSEIEAGAVYETDDEPECEGHHDDDRALLIGGPYYCDGSCAA